MYKQPTLTKWWNYHIFEKIFYCYFKYTGRHFLGCVLFVACCQGYLRNQEGIKIELQKKVHKKNCMRDITFLAARPPSYVTFYCFFRLLPPPFQVTCFLNGPYKDSCYKRYSVWWYLEWTDENTKISKISCHLILAGWNI